MDGVNGWKYWPVDWILVAAYSPNQGTIFTGKSIMCLASGVNVHMLGIWWHIKWLITMCVNLHNLYMLHSCGHLHLSTLITYLFDTVLKIGSTYYWLSRLVAIIYAIKISHHWFENGLSPIQHQTIFETYTDLSIRNYQLWIKVCDIKDDIPAIIIMNYKCHLQNICYFVSTSMSHVSYDISTRKSKDYVYGILVYKVLGIWKGYYRVINTSFMHETVNGGKKLW